VEKDEEDEEVVISTQEAPPVQSVSEEGEISPSPLVRCNAVAL
jgi:hypothetical protein